MDAYFVCLANSYKRGGRCVAGVEIRIDTSMHWDVVRRDDGTPRWILPIARETDFGEIPEIIARDIPLWSVAKLSDADPCPEFSHREDVHFSQIQAIGTVRPDRRIIEQFVDNNQSTLFHSTDNSISIEAYQLGDHSLTMVHPDGFTFHLDATRQRAKYRLYFSYSGANYDMPITDPAFYGLLEQRPQLTDELTDVYLVLSLGLEYEGRHHKLIAAMIMPGADVGAEVPFGVITLNRLREKSVRRFSRAERRACKKAIVVPSNDGPSVYFKMRDGSEKFVMLESGSRQRMWSVVNLRHALLLTYEDAQGREVQRIRMLPLNNWQSILNRIRTLKP